jgi:hypothetical protein
VKNLDWNVVRAHYETRTTVRPLTGQSTLAVVHVDDEKVCFRQLLWRDCVTRRAIETAMTLLDGRELPVKAIEFAEELRIHYSNGPTVVTGCSRIPNLSAVVLKDLGFLC